MDVAARGREHATLVDHFRAGFLERPEERTYRFLVDGEGEPLSVSNAELDRRVRAIAATLAQRARVGDRALIVCPPGLDYVASFFACLYAGVVAVPVYPPNPVLLKRTLPRLVSIITDASPAVVLAPAFIASIAGQVAELAPGLANLAWQSIDDIDVAAAQDWRLPGIGPDDIAFLQYTSGSTGQPKGVMLSHHNLLSNLDAIHQLFVADDRDPRLVIWLPPYHDMGLIGGLLEPAYGRFPVTFMSPVSFLKRPGRWLKAISDFRATISGGPNFAYDLCVAKVPERDRPALDLSSLRLLFSGAEPVRAATIERFSTAFQPSGFHRKVFYPCFGLAEATLCVSGGDRDIEPVARRLQAEALAAGRVVEAVDGEPYRENVGCGQAMPGHHIVIVDRETLTRLPDGQIGEIWFSGPSVAKGYWGRAEETEEVFAARLSDTGEGPFLRTGDLGFLDGGELFVTGRSKDVIIIAGRNHYPQDIEQSVEECDPELRPGGCVAFQVDLDGAERLVVVQEVRGNPDGADAARIILAIRAVLAEAHGLDAYDVVLVRRGTIPKTSSGKVQRSACRAEYLGNSLQAVAPSARATATAAQPQPAQPQPAQPAMAKGAPAAAQGAPAQGAPVQGAPVQGAPVQGAPVQGAPVQQPVAAQGAPAAALQPSVAAQGAARPAAERAPSAETLKRAYRTMERLQRRIEEYERARFEPIAIVGLAARFPGGVVDAETYWDLLSNGRDAVGEVPADRFDVDAFYDAEPHRTGKIISRWGGFLDHVDRFDHEFFGISRREAVSMDPQQRLLLEVAWEALEDAGQTPAKLAGSTTGVFVGMCGGDYSSQVFADPEQIQAHASTGNARGIASGRLSYLLDLKGPSITLDTACSSSLVAVHQACQGLRLGETDMAVCGAVNVVLSPHLSISFSQFPEMLAADGRCKTFDASADGFVRSEGCGVVVLKRLSDAVRDGDRVHAVIRGSALNQDGRSSGLTAPSGSAQRAVLRRALRAAGVEPKQVGYIETHGAGTKLGDPIEVEALAEVYGREQGAPLFLGAVKTNLGHLEAVAGMAGLIKAALCVDRGLIPPNLHFNTLNPHISLHGTTFTVPTRLTPWPLAGRRFAGLSSFGFSGTNAHVILEQAPAPAEVEPDGRRPGSVLALSAKSETALLKLARRYQDRLLAPTPPPTILDFPTGNSGEDPEKVQDRRDLEVAGAADVCFSANSGRAHFPYRLAAVGGTAGELADRLADYVRGDAGDGLSAGKVPPNASTDVVFLFTGQGPQRAGMARQLYETQPTFRRVLDRCDEILRPVLDTPLLSAIYPDDPGSELINNMEYAQPGLFAVEYALAEMWTSWGVEPAAVLGHSLGEYAAACFAGVMSLEDGLRLVAERGRLLRQISGTGVMAAIFASGEDVAKELVEYDPSEISIAAVNGPANTAISGVRDTVDRVCAAFTARGVEVKRLHISTSSHSPLVEPVLEPLRQVLHTVEFNPPRIPLVSNVTGQLWRWDETPDTSYWCRHAREAVLFADGVTALYEQGYRTFLEVSPAPTLLGLAGDILPPDADLAMVPSLRPAQEDWEVLLSSVGRLYVHGAGIDWAGFDRDYTRSRVRLPRYPFDPVRCWHEVAGGATYLPLGLPGMPVPGGADGRSGARDGDGSGGAGEGRAVRARASTATGRSRISTLPTTEELLAIPPAERLDALLPKLLDGVRGALGSKSSTVDLDEPLSGLGLDSLMAVELRNEIHSRLKVTISIATFLSGATVRTVGEQIVAGLGAGKPDEAGAIRRVRRAGSLAEDLLAQVEASAGTPAGTQQPAAPESAPSGPSAPDTPAAPSAPDTPSGPSVTKASGAGGTPPGRQARAGARRRGGERP